MGRHRMEWCHNTSSVGAESLEGDKVKGSQVRCVVLGLNLSRILVERHCRYAEGWRREKKRRGEENVEKKRKKGKESVTEPLMLGSSLRMTELN